MITAHKYIDGFTMIELIIVIAILITISGIVVPFAFNSKQETQAAAIANTADSLRRTVTRYYIDNKSLPVEDSRETGPGKHNLFFKPSGSNGENWKGPYIQEPFRRSAANVGLSWRLGGFDVNDNPTWNSLPGGVGIPDEVCILRIANVPEGVARRVNELLDPHEDQSSDVWKQEGNVFWGNSRNLTIQASADTGSGTKSGPSGSFDSGGSTSGGGTSGSGSSGGGGSFGSGGLITPKTSAGSGTVQLGPAMGPSRDDLEVLCIVIFYRK